MIYLESFKFPSWEEEDQFLCSYYSPRNPNKYAQREAYFHEDTAGNYPFGVLSDHSLRSLDFAPITILYGGNGSVKLTPDMVGNIDRYFGILPKQSKMA